MIEERVTLPGIAPKCYFNYLIKKTVHLQEYLAFINDLNHSYYDIISGYVHCKNRFLAEIIGQVVQLNECIEVVTNSESNGLRVIHFYGLHSYFKEFGRKLRFQ